MLYRINLLRFYTLFKDSFEMDRYVRINLSSSERSVLAQIRFGILPLHIETGRFNNTKLEDRICNLCQQDKIEDECHFLFECDAYEVPRNIWSHSVLNCCLDFHYLEQNNQLRYIFNDCPRPTAKFIETCLDIRKNVLYY